MAQRTCRTLKELGPALIGALLFLCIWEVCVLLQILSPLFFPPPHRILLRLWHLGGQNSLFITAVYCSLKRFFWGACAAIPIASLLGIIAGISPRCARIITPFVATSFPLPKVALLPLLLVFFGIHDTSKIILIAIGIFYYIFFTVCHATRRITTQYRDIYTVYHIKPHHVWWHIFIKGTTLDFLYGCKVGLSYGLSMVVVSELMAAQNGIGLFIWNAWDQFRIIDMYAGLVVLGMLGCSIFMLFNVLIAHLPWNKGTLYGHHRHSHAALS